MTDDVDFEDAAAAADVVGDGDEGAEDVAGCGGGVVGGGGGGGFVGAVPIVTKQQKRSRLAERTRWRTAEIVDSSWRWLQLMTTMTMMMVRLWIGVETTMVSERPRERSTRAELMRPRQLRQRRPQRLQPSNADWNDTWHLPIIAAAVVVVVLVVAAADVDRRRTCGSRLARSQRAPDAMRRQAVHRRKRSYLPASRNVYCYIQSILIIIIMKFKNEMLFCFLTYPETEGDVDEF